MTSRRLVLLLALALATGGCAKGSSPSAPVPSGPGTIRITTAPQSASARLDGAATGAYTATEFGGVAAGTHQVAISMEGYADTTVTLSVAAGSTVTDTVPLRPLAGTPGSISELLAGYFEVVGPLAVSPTGTIYITGYKNFVAVLAVVSSAGLVQQQSAIPHLDATPASDIALDSQSNAYVVPASFHNTILKFDAAGSFQTSFGRRSSSTDNIAGIAIGPGDTIHVSAVYGVPMVEKYTPSGVFAYAFATGAAFAGRLEVDADGNVYVGAGPNMSAPQIAKFGRTGTPIGTWSVPEWPSAITRGPSSTLYVSSLLGGGVPSNTPKAPSRIERYSATGVRLARWGTETRSLPYLDRHGVDALGNVLLPLRNDERVLRYGAP